jgi:uncharacterized spore protein YtfJ
MAGADPEVDPSIDKPLAEAVGQASSSEPPPIERLLRTLSERLGAVADARAVFGEPVTQGDVTVIPVARIVGGFGGGGGPEIPRAGHVKGGLGAGAAFVTLPIGFIEIRQGHARFRRLQDSWLPGGIASGVLGGLILPMLHRLVTFGKR